MTNTDPMSDGAAEAGSVPPKRRRWKRWVVLVLATPILLLILYTLFAYNWSYSAGDRSGILRKFSRKGWLCKTWEGELAMTTVPGVMPEPWAFTVRDDGMANDVNAMIGKQVVLHYKEHRGLWSDCFGDTQYFVDSVRVLQ
jgi:hypothetical protein